MVSKSRLYRLCSPKNMRPRELHDRWPAGLLARLALAVSLDPQGKCSLVTSL